MSPVSSMPTVSVILLTYNQEAFVAEAVRSWLRQDLPAFELVLSDDASTDRTRDVIEAELARHPATQVRVVRAHRPSNVGVLANVNAAMAACTGDIIVAAAGDDVSEPARLRLTAEIFAADPTVQAVVAVAATEGVVTLSACDGIICRTAREVVVIVTCNDVLNSR